MYAHSTVQHQMGDASQGEGVGGQGHMIPWMGGYGMGDIPENEHSDLGIAPAIVGGAVAVAQKLLDQHPKDKSRLAANNTAFMLAQQGNTTALQFLKARSGRYGTIVMDAAVPTLGITKGMPVSGWATSSTCDDAGQKYDTLVASGSGTGAPAPTASGAASLLSFGSSGGTSSASMPLLLGLGVLGAVLLSKRRH